MHRAKRLLALPLLGMFLTLVGCGKSGPTRFDLHGEVTYKGKPLPAGVLIFDPDVKRGNDGPQGYAMVKNGKFDTHEHGRPVAEGPHVVRIQGFDGKEGNELPLGKTLFKEYTAPMDLDSHHNEVELVVPDKVKK